MRMFILLALVVIAGCASTPIPTDQAEPTKDIVDRTVTTPRDGASQVVIKRDSGATGIACSIRISLNGRPVANLRAGQVVTVYLSPAEYIFGAASTGLCGGGDAEVQVQLGRNEMRTLRVSIDQNASIRIGPTAH